MTMVHRLMRSSYPAARRDLRYALTVSSLSSEISCWSLEEKPVSSRDERVRSICLARPASRTSATGWVASAGLKTYITSRMNRLSPMTEDTSSRRADSLPVPKSPQMNML